MFESPSLMYRIAIGKTIGLIVGAGGFIFLTYFSPELDWMLRWGVLFWYITLGAIIGVYGVFTRHPVLQLPMPWWFRAPVIGAWMNFVLVLFAYDKFETLILQTLGQDTFFSSPFWFVLEGAIVAFVMGFFATTLAGEGKDTLREMENVG